MNPLSADTLLSVWERGRDRHPLDRALLLAGAACPEQSYGCLADWPVGRRDGALLQLRCATFGPEFEVYLDCPSCGERLEFAFAGDALQLPEPADGAAIITVQGWRFRLPTSRDLARIAAETDLERAARTLLELCYLADSDRTAPEWSTALLEEAELYMGAADPQADLELDIACAACGHAWKTGFDIGGFFWEEIAARAARLLQEVHLLARAYGWSEREILALSDARRAAYIDRVSA